MWRAVPGRRNSLYQGMEVLEKITAQWEGMRWEKGLKEGLQSLTQSLNYGPQQRLNELNCSELICHAKEFGLYLKVHAKH